MIILMVMGAILWVIDWLEENLNQTKVFDLILGCIEICLFVRLFIGFTDNPATIEPAELLKILMCCGRAVRKLLLLLAN